MADGEAENRMAGSKSAGPSGTGDREATGGATTAALVSELPERQTTTCASLLCMRLPAAAICQSTRCLAMCDMIVTLELIVMHTAPLDKSQRPCGMLNAVL
eukprot:scaffold137058_cov31-Prasinocladus_malaysianus.AAC.3